MRVELTDSLCALRLRPFNLVHIPSQRIELEVYRISSRCKPERLLIPPPTPRVSNQTPYARLRRVQIVTTLQVDAGSSADASSGCPRKFRKRSRSADAHWARITKIQKLGFHKSPD
jgi:hypothetical protein